MLPRRRLGSYELGCADACRYWWSKRAGLKLTRTVTIQHRCENVLPEHRFWGSTRLACPARHPHCWAPPAHAYGTAWHRALCVFDDMVPAKKQRAWAKYVMKSEPASHRANQHQHG